MRAVPEFGPLAAILAAASMAGIIAKYGRLRSVN
jgi:hypothetical protein